MSFDDEENVAMHSLRHLLQTWHSPTTRRCARKVLLHMGMRPLIHDSEALLKTRFGREGRSLQRAEMTAQLTWQQQRTDHSLRANSLLDKAANGNATQVAFLNSERRENGVTIVAFLE